MLSGIRTVRGMAVMTSLVLTWGCASSHEVRQSSAARPTISTSSSTASSFTRGDLGVPDHGQSVAVPAAFAPTDAAAHGSPDPRAAIVHIAPDRERPARDRRLTMRQKRIFVLGLTSTKQARR